MRKLILMGVFFVSTLLYGEEQTVITSDRLEFAVQEENNVFLFQDNVEVNSENLHVTCDKLEVFSAKTNHSPKQEIADIGSVEFVIADGHVHITQEDKVAEAGHAEIFPKEGKIVLTDSPKVTGPDGVVEGYRMVLYKNDKKAYVEGEPGTKQRPKIILGNLPELSFDDKEKQENS